MGGCHPLSGAKELRLAVDAAASQNVMMVVMMVRPSFCGFPYMRQIIFDIGSWLLISAGSSAYGTLWHPRMRYDGHPGDVDSAVESRPPAPFSRIFRLSTRILYLPSVMQGY